MALEPLWEVAPTAVVSPVGANAERWEEPQRQEVAMVLEPLQEEELTTGESHVGANAERWKKPVRHEAKMVLEPLREEALPAVLERKVVELKDELEPLWEEAAVTASADGEGCESELSRSVQCSFVREPD